MRLNEVIIRNFKCIKELKVAIPETVPEREGSADFLTILGRNNVGKSTILEAIRLALPNSDITKPSLDHFPGKNASNGPIEVEFEFTELTDNDKLRQGIRTHVHNDRYRIKKVWEEPLKGFTVSAYHPQKEIMNWPEKGATKESFIQLGDAWKTAFEAFETQKGQELKKVTVAIRNELQSYILDSYPELVIDGEAKWQLNPGGLQQNVDAALPKLIFVPALKHTKEEAGVSEKSSTARQIVEAMFSTELSGYQAIRKFTEAAVEVKEVFSGNGDGNEVIKNLEAKISNKLSRLIPLSAKLDFNPPDFTSDLASKTVLELSDGSLNTRPEHQGHGAQRALVISLLELFSEITTQRNPDEPAKNILLLVEEPEIYLHPQMCRKMRDVLMDIARYGTAQVICTSHSPTFINVADRHDGICILRRDTQNGLYSVQRTDDLFPGASAVNLRDRLRMLLDFDPAVLEAFFAERVCLVEGDCEIAAVEAIANKLIQQEQLDSKAYVHARRDITIINCRGKWTIRAFQRVLNGFQVPYIVVHDVDLEGESGANLEILQELNGEEHRRLVHSPNFEQQIFGEEWSRDKPWKASRKINGMPQVNNDLLRFFYFVTGLSPATAVEMIVEAAPSA
ncbi:ATP-dependent nuclease [Paenibacillus zanthoxyli]|uniref:ATP-dependent nuclease n=1 Tax=Paenibacillus zanthoxyli TaxID=369399 RepID=UPI000470D935|nr:AAA family ATPase [Paenibacillus zanthoxyli]